jgi:hypothetical protein
MGNDGLAEPWQKLLRQQILMGCEEIHWHVPTVVTDTDVQFWWSPWEMEMNCAVAVLSSVWLSSR